MNSDTERSEVDQQRLVRQCGCGAECRFSDERCSGQVIAMKYDGPWVSEHLCEYHRENYKRK